MLLFLVWQTFFVYKIYQTCDRHVFAATLCEIWHVVKISAVEPGGKIYDIVVDLRTSILSYMSLHSAAHTDISS